MNTSIILNPKAIQCELFFSFFSWIIFRIQDKDYYVEPAISGDKFYLYFREREKVKNWFENVAIGDIVLTIEINRNEPQLNSTDFSNYAQIFNEALKYGYEILIDRVDTSRDKIGKINLDKRFKCKNLEHESGNLINKENVLFNLKHLRELYATDEEFLSHLLSDEVTVPITQLLKWK